MAALSPASIYAADPYFDFVTVLLSGSGTVGSSVITGNEITSKVVSQYSGTHPVLISSAQSKFGGTSYKIDGLGNLSIPSASTIVMGTGNFTVECWFYADTASASMYVYGNFSSNAVAHNALQWINGGLYWYYAGNTAITMTGSALSLNTWYHFAGVRVANTLTLYIDGVARGTATYTNAFGNSGTPLYIGNTNWTDQQWKGYIDDFRITQSFARYTADFTPPASEFPWLDHIYFTKRIIDEPIGYVPLMPPEGLDSLGPRKRVVNVMQKRIAYFGGSGKITGTVKVSPNLPAHREVILMDEVAHVLLKSTWSDPVTGAYEFDYLDMAATFTVLAYDYTKAYRAVIADRVTPELMT